jgi:hypothetical protein
MAVITGMRVAIAVSIAVHVALIAWVQLHPQAPSPVKRSLPTPEASPIEVKPDPEPMVVALLDDHSVPTSTIDPTTLRHSSIPSKHHAAISVASTTGTTLVGPSTTTVETPPGTSLMSMRHPGDDKHPLQGGSDIIAALGGAPQWGYPPTGDELDDQRAADLARREAAANAELQPDGQGMKSEHKTFTIKVAPDGSIASINDKKNWQWKSPLSAEFDATDALMRSHGMDPYASYKKKILDDTREQRFEMGKQYKTQQLAMSGRYMEKNVAWLVSRAPNKSELKQGLFELWDECAESGSEELVAGGAAARAQLLGFIKRTLPATSPDAFTAEELTRFNKQRKSRAEFAPYGG